MNYKVGDKVRFIGEKSHKEIPDIYPPVGTIGVITEVDEKDKISPVRVDWGKDSGVGNNEKRSFFSHTFWAKAVDIEPVVESEIKFKVGDKVRFIDEKRHIDGPDFYPPVGTIGTIVDMDSSNNDRLDIKVEWGEESGVVYNGSDECYAWWVSYDAIVPFDGLNKSEEEVEDLSSTEVDDVAALAELVIKKQIEIKKLKEENAKIVARNTELNNMVTRFRNLGFQILNVGTDINIGVNKNV